MPRRAIFNQPMTAAERARRYREKQLASRPNSVAELSDDQLRDFISGCKRPRWIKKLVHEGIQRERSNGQ